METVAHKEMNRTVTFILTMLLTVHITSVCADGKRLTSDFEVPIGTTTVCDAKDKTGFVWLESGKWEKSSFTKDTYIIRKVLAPETFKPDDSCYFENLKYSDDEFAKTTHLSRCYTISKLGITEQPPSEQCIERYYQRELLVVHCKDSAISFEPNKSYVKRSNSTHKPESELKRGYRNSLYVEHGECTTN